MVITVSSNNMTKTDLKLAKWIMTVEKRLAMILKLDEAQGELNDKQDQINERVTTLLEKLKEVNDL